jgi:hypothetical protein
MGYLYLPMRQMIRTTEKIEEALYSHQLRLFPDQNSALRYGRKIGECGAVYIKRVRKSGWVVGHIGKFVQPIDRNPNQKPFFRVILYKTSGLTITGKLVMKITAALPAA